MAVQLLFRRGYSYDCPYSADFLSRLYNYSQSCQLPEKIKMDDCDLIIVKPDTWPFVYHQL